MKNLEIKPDHPVLMQNSIHSQTIAVLTSNVNDLIRFYSYTCLLINIMKSKLSLLRLMLYLHATMATIDAHQFIDPCSRWLYFPKNNS